MDRSIFIAMTGAQQTMLAQAANANNLANASTTGFRADFSQARSMPLFGDGLASRVYAMTERPGTDFSPGALQATGRSLDVAVNGPGWLAVQAPDGTEAFTRAGDLQVSPDGGLVTTGAGFLVLGEGGPIAVPPFQKMEIGSDGTISVLPLGQATTELVQIDRIKLVNPPAEGLRKGPDGLIRSHEPGGAAADADVTLVSGSLEASNVNMVSGLVDMVTLARRFELQVMMMETANENESRTTELMRLT